MPRLIILALLFNLSFIVGEEPLCKQVKLASNAPFPVGTALDTEKLKFEEKYWTTAIEQFNSFTPEMILKPHYVHPKEGQFNFTEIDHLMQFCKENKIRLHGHTLIWHKSLPPWIENFEGSDAQWEELMKNHIQTIVSHCKSYVRSWDVVNEAFNDDGTFRKNIWYKHIGESYIEKAYRYAQQADSTCQFFYNDYSIEKYGGKLESVLRLCTQMRARGIKIDGIGMQMHVTLQYPTTDEINDAAKRIQKAGFKVHYSELDVRVTEAGLFLSKKKLLQLQKQRYREIVEGYMSLDPKNRFGITMWGVSDNDSWLTEDKIRSRPLLYNSNYKIKPAYCGFLEGLQNK